MHKIATFAAMKSFLFVYGTLLHSVKTTVTDHLRKQSSFVGEAYVQGHLYDLGSYPGLVLDDSSDTMVYGHLLELKTPKDSLSFLDAYEAIPDGRTNTSEYRRDEVRIKFGADFLTCWAYLYNLPTSGLKKIESGNYLEYIKKNPRHLAFIQSV